MSDPEDIGEHDPAVRRQIIRELRELIAALDRRVPHLERTGEAAIARDAAALKREAQQRLESLESPEQIEP
jgi:hypothetical protein